MKSLAREFKRAPARITATVLAIALAVAAVGVLAVPDVASSSLQESSEADQLADITANVTAFDAPPELVGVDEAEARVVGSIDFDGSDVTVVGFDATNQQINIVSATDGRLPAADGELLVSESLASAADLPGVVVGVGGTTAWAGEDVLFTNEATARQLTGVDDYNHLLLRVSDQSEDNLLATVDDLRDSLRAEGAALTAFPLILPDGQHPIEPSLEQISTLIGLLGIVAGIVALVLLASTTNTLISERTREVAIMRALGGRRRAVRRRLRGIAIAIAAIGALIGIPLGIAVANVVARVVLVEFAGITPAIGVSLTVVAGSFVAAVVGARLVAGRAARRVTKLPLAEALRDRDGAPYGRRRSDRLLARIPTGGLLSRLAVRNAARRRARSLAVVAQVTAAVAAGVVVASLASSVTAFDEAELEPWRWETKTLAADPGYPYAAGVDGQVGAEAGFEVEGRVDDWEVEVFGLDPDTEIFDTTVSEGRWISDDDPNGVVLPRGFADHIGAGVGDTVEVELASGTESYDVVGLHPLRSRGVIIATDTLGAALGANGAANVVWSAGGEPPQASDTLVVSETVTLSEVAAEDQAARQVVLSIFTVIGVIVVAVGSLGIASTLAVNLYERRHELAGLRAAGAGRAELRRILLVELLPLFAIGWALGWLAGWGGAVGLIAAFEASNAVEIGMVFATAAVPIAGAAALVAALLIAHLAAGRTQKRPAAVTLRAAA